MSKHVPDIELKPFACARVAVDYEGARSALLCVRDVRLTVCRAFWG